jgi:hypothetical protein
MLVSTIFLVIIFFAMIIITVFVNVKDRKATTLKKLYVTIVGLFVMGIISIIVLIICLGTYVIQALT